MIPLFTKLLPYVLLGYFVYRALREPIFFFGIPFLLFMRMSIFFDSITIFKLPYETSTEILLLFWIALSWIIVRYRFLPPDDYKIPRHLKLTPLDYSILGLVGITIFGFISNQFEYVNNYLVFNEFIVISSIFLGYFIIKDVIRFSTRESLTSFLFNIVLVNSVASMLYIFNQAFDLPIYRDIAAIEEVVDGELISRSFWFMPILSFFSIAYLLAFKNILKPVNMALLAVNILGIFISYTRTFMIIILVMILLYTVMLSFREKNFNGIFRRIALGVLFITGFYIAVSIILPANTNFLIGRFTSMQDTMGDEESNTLLIRFANTKEIFDYITGEKWILGFGPITDNQVPVVSTMKSTTADLVWTGVMFTWGIGGVLLFVLLYVFGILKAFNLFIKGDIVLSKFGLLFFLVIISQLIEGFASWTFLAPDKYGMSLWYFAILSGLYAQFKATETEQAGEAVQNVEEDKVL
jgi:hypothetical protein